MMVRRVTRRTALAFVRKHGVVLESARGPVPSLAAAVAGGPIRGSWWGHKRGHEIFAITRAIRASPDVLVCRLVRGKVTYVHARVWAALARVADRFPAKNLAAVHERHTPQGRHEVDVVPFARWLPAEVQAQARDLSADEAMAALGSWTIRM
jgi:hypothetical protein